MTQSLTAGFFGKVPTHGDFVARRFPAVLRPVWDGWIQAGITMSRTQLGAGWPATWLTSPLWHFALGAAVTGGEPVLGVMIPCVDRVGRQFPLTLALALPPSTDLLATVAAGEAWFDGLDALARSVLQEGFELEVFDDILAHGLPPLAPVATAPAATGTQSWLLWQPLDEGMTLAQSVVHQASALSASLVAECTFWWTEGLPDLPAVLAARRGLPPPESFVELLQGPTV